MTESEVSALVLRGRILWGALLAAHVGMAALSLSGIGMADEPPAIPFLLPIIVMIALGSATVSLLVWRRARMPLAGFHTEPSVADLHAALPRYVIAWAMTESIATLGLVLALVGYSTAAWAAFAVPALVIMLVQRP